MLRSSEDDNDEGSAGEWIWSVASRERHKKNQRILHTGRVKVQQLQTGRTYRGAVAVLERGDLDFDGRVRLDMSEEEFSRAGRLLGSGLVDGDEESVLDEEFSDLRYPTRSLLSTGGREFLTPIIERCYENFRHSLSNLHHDHRHLLASVHELGLDDPRLLTGLARVSLEASLRSELEKALEHSDEAAREALKTVIEELRHTGIEPDLSVLRPRLEQALESSLVQHDLRMASRLLALADESGIPVLLFRAQERFLEIASELDDRRKILLVGKKLGLSETLILSTLGGEENE